jgi:hypothetical protein
MKIKLIIQLLVLSLSIFLFSAQFAYASIKVCHCNPSEYSGRTKVALNNMDGEGVYGEKNIARGSCENLDCTIDACFIVFTHPTTEKSATSRYVVLNGDTIYMGWRKDTNGFYRLSWGGKAHSDCLN